MILLYIDPGTGSMLFSVLLGIFTAVFFSLRKLWIRIKYTSLGGKTEKMDREKIPVVIYSDSKRYWNVFRPICEELDKRGIRTEYWTQSEDDPAFESVFDNVKCRFIGNINRAVTRLNIMNASVCLSTTPGLEVYQWKRSKNTDWYVHVYHTVSSGLLYRLFGLDFYDAVLLSGDFIEENIRILEEKRGLQKKELIKAGLPHFDIMEREVGLRTFEKADTTTVLLAPTWGVNSLFNQLGDELIDSLIATGYNIVIRPHPQSFSAEKELIDRLMAKYPENAHLHWNRDNDNINVLGSSDIMISDYSGVLYDYTIIFDKPVIYSLVEFDKSPYDAYCVEEDPKMITILPEIAYELKKEDLPDIKAVIDNALTDTQKAEGRAYVREHFWYDHGRAAINSVDYIEDRIKRLKEEKNA